MPDFSQRKGAYLGALCKNKHDHEGGGSYRDKTNSTCFECTAERIKRWSKTEAGARARKATKTKHAKAIKEASKAYRQRAKERIAEYNKKYAALNPDWHAAYYRDYNARRKAVKLQAIPCWADLESITLLYKEAQEKTKLEAIQYHVDHIVPLISDVVCGLHCETNLRIITQTENCSKGNRWWPDMP